MTEENDVVAKVQGLMTTLDHVKKYRELSSSLKIFVIVAGGSILAYMLIRVFLLILSGFSLMNSGFVLELSVFLLVVPFAGVVTGISYVGNRLKSVKTGEWKQILSQGFPGALELLSKIEWEKQLDEISDLKSITLQYGVAKLSCYVFLVFFVTAIFTGSAPGNYLTYVGLLVVFSVLVSVALGGRDVMRRYRESQSLGHLLRELRSFQIEFKRNEFEIV